MERKGGLPLKTIFDVGLILFGTEAAMEGAHSNGMVLKIDRERKRAGREREAVQNRKPVPSKPPPGRPGKALAERAQTRTLVHPPAT